MKSDAMQVAKREMQSTFSLQGVWVALLSIGIVLGIMGPFETGEELRLIPRLAYWVSISVGSFAVGTFMMSLGCTLLAALGTWPARIVASIFNGLVIFALILLLNFFVFGIRPKADFDLLIFAAQTIAVALVIGIALNLLQSEKPEQGTEVRPDEPPRLLRRLPLEKRGALLSISVQDHYVEITTTKGTETLHMRLSDAMDETDPREGLQIHRSHWVSLRAVTAVRREGAKGVITTSDGRELPVSRTFLPSLKEAGLLPG